MFLTSLEPSELDRLEAALKQRLENRKLRRQADADYEIFAREFLKIRTKRGEILPLVFNRSQRHIHERLEAQRAATSKVRALILKGRQQGCSTYVGGRFYHRTTRTGGLRCYILTHEDPATQNLFEMVERFHEHLPGDVRPSTGIANAKELIFDKLDSGYKIGTAATTATGRSSTLQLFHGSEVALWRNAEGHAAGVLQAIPNEPGTEIILESTANGVGNWFHQKWREAESGQSEFIAVFTPWFWDDGYRLEPGADFTLTLDEREYAELYGLDDAQMAWRRNKVQELGDELLFMQEYPGNAAEAFQMSGHDSFISALLIAKARKREDIAGSGPLVIGLDPAWKGADSSAMAWRRGREVLKIEKKAKLDTMETAGWLRQVIDRDKPVKVFMDAGGVGAGVYDRAQEWGEPYSRIVVAVNFGSKPLEPQPLDDQGKPYGGPLNRRAEMWLKSKQWLEDPAGARIPDSDSLQADACGPTYSYDSYTRLKLEAKEDMRRRGVPSPDEWDAVALSFAEPTPIAATKERKHRRARGGWMAA